MREISIWGAGVVFWRRRDLDILAFGRKTVRIGTLTCRSVLTKLTKQCVKNSLSVKNVPSLELCQDSPKGFFCFLLVGIDFCVGTITIFLDILIEKCFSGIVKTYQ